MIFNIIFFFLFLICYIFMKYDIYRKEKRHINEMKNLVDNLAGENEESIIREEVKEDYINALKKIKYKRETIKRSMEELKEYKKELKMTRNSLLAKLTELEHINDILERKVHNLSNLNAVGKSVLSELNLDRIISTILDAYFVLTRAKKISLYLWEDNKLVQKAFKGASGINISGDKNYENIKTNMKSKHTNEYIEIASSIKEEEEQVIILELKVKGKELGAVYIIEDIDKGSVKEDEMETMSALAIHVAIAINNAKMYEELAVKERIEKEVSIAAEIQKNLLPHDIKYAFGINIASYFKPAKEIGGDYYDYYISAEGRFGVTIADVSGKGVPAALMMTLIRTILRTLNFLHLPDKMLTKLNENIYSDMSEEMFVTVFHSEYNFHNSTLYYSNAGHNPLLIYRKSTDEIIEENVKGVAIGFMESYSYRLGKVEIGKGDVLIYYTDGITEAENMENELYGMENLKNAIYESRHKSSEQIKEAVLKSVNNFRKEKEQTDDITLVVLKKD